MNKLYHIISFACMLIITFAVLMAMYMSADGIYFNVPMVLSEGGEVLTTQSTYHPGDEVQATLNYCKHRDISGVMNWQLVDTYIRLYPSQRVDLPLGCHSYNLDLGTVPSDVLNDQYHFTGTLMYRINSLTSVSLALYSNTFTVERP